MPLRVDGIDVRLRRVVLRQHLDQPAAAQVTRDVPLRTHQDAVTIQRPAHRDSAVIGGEIAADFHGFGMLTFGTIERQSPYAIRFVTLANADAIVAGEFTWRPRNSVAGQVGGCRAEHSPIGRDSTRDHPRVRRLAEADAYVEGVLGQRRGLTESCSWTSTCGYLRTKREITGAT